MKRPAKQPMTKRLHAAINAFHAPAYGKEAPEIPKARAPSRDLEHKEQCAVIQWWELTHKQFNVAKFSLFAIPNGGSRHMLTAVRLKAEGVRPGVSDLFLCVARRGAHGAFIEMKSKEGTLQTEQIAFQYMAHNEGYEAYTCYGSDEAIKYITSYLTGAT